VLANILSIKVIYLNCSALAAGDPVVATIEEMFAEFWTD
jgi:hypothetical protein